MLLMMIKNVDADNVDCGLSCDIELLCYRWQRQTVQCICALKQWRGWPRENTPPPHVFRTKFGHYVKGSAHKCGHLQKLGTLYTPHVSRLIAVGIRPPEELGLWPAALGLILEWG